MIRKSEITLTAVRPGIYAGEYFHGDKKFIYQVIHGEIRLNDKRIGKAHDLNKALNLIWEKISSYSDPNAGIGKYKQPKGEELSLCSVIGGQSVLIRFSVYQREGNTQECEAIIRKLSDISLDQLRARCRGEGPTTRRIDAEKQRRRDWRGYVSH